jgi:hypothetical protein
VDYSVRAQDFIVKHGTGLGRTTDDLSAFNGLQSAETTNASVGGHQESTMAKTSKFGLDSLGPLALPRITEKDKSPFKGFIDISLVTQKMRRGIATQAGGRNAEGRGHGFHSVKAGGPNPLAKSSNTNPFKA